MTTVFVVTQRDWEDSEVIGVFTTFEKATQFIEGLETLAQRVNCTIIPCEVK